ncbi:MAG: flagellar export chaperone FlgN [Planctomycetota bacterium]
MKKDVRALVNQLQTWLQEEVAAQRSMRALLTDQERAIRATDTVALEETGRGIERELAAASRRERRRSTLLTGLGQAWGVDPGALTLTSIGERLGIASPETERILRLRAELREETALVVKLGRRIAALARYHGALLADLMHALLGVGDDRPAEDDGMLINARA